MQEKRISVIFFRTAAGGEPVREWLKALQPVADRKQIGADVQTVEFGWPIGMPVCRPLRERHLRGEVESQPKPNRPSALLHDSVDRMVLLPAFIKKTQRTPPQELELALRNKRLHEAEGEKRR